MHRILALVAIALLLAVPAIAQEPAGDGPRKLTLPRFSYPTWSPDGGRILYESNVTGWTPTDPTRCA
ncbi:MAG: hypothetical protein R3326_00110 [Gemmatimonadota bacterium]|nr:hypothetical protein [Gemmatimonadota bacterium]